jgi:cytochrome c peroxidase
MPTFARRLAWMALSAIPLATVVGRSPVARATPAPELPADARLRAEYRRPTTVPHPEDNAPTPERVALGKALFFDPRLSGSGDISCGSCHVPDRGWQDGRPKAVGTRAQRLERHTPTVLNTAYAAALFWDGRASSLEEQSLGPIQASGEMDMRLDTLSAKLARIAEYRERFGRAYPGQPIDGTRIAQAIASFERTIVSSPAPFDRWVEGDERAMGPAAKRGFALFNGKANCANCHSGWRFTDDSFDDIGVPGSDSGRARVLPGIESMEFAFKTPTLRDLGRRAPYMHDGSERTLADVIDLYDRGGRVTRPSLAAEIKPLHLSAAEKADLLAFLSTLEGPAPVVHAPALPR